MAQRVYLFLASADTLSLIEEYVTDTRRRPAIAHTLAERAAAHQRVVAASERVVARVRHRDEQPFLYAANCLPYFLACQSSAEILEAVVDLERPRTDQELDEFFIGQARKLGYKVGKLDHREYAARGVDILSQVVAHFLDQAPLDDCETAWGAIGMLLGRFGPAWWQARNRWLGYAAYRERFSELGPVEGTERLQEILQSTAILIPRLSVAGGGGHLHPGGEAYRTCAFIGATQLDVFLDLVDGPGWDKFRPVIEEAFGSTEVDGWRMTVTSAARYAKLKGAHLLEGDEIFGAAYRWPPL